MVQLQELSQQNHLQFVERVVASRVVWGLRSSAGWAVCDSAEQEGVEVMPFWSDRAYAARAARDEWAAYEPASISLDAFIETWLEGMHDDGALVGTNWDADNAGMEIPAADLTRELSDAIDLAAEE